MDHYKAIRDIMGLTYLISWYCTNMITQYESAMCFVTNTLFVYNDKLLLNSFYPFILNFNTINKQSLSLSINIYTNQIKKIDDLYYYIHEKLIHVYNHCVLGVSFLMES